MAIKGSGLPLAKTGNEVLQPTGSVGAISTAAEWQKIAQTGAQLFETGADMYQRDANKARVGYMADQEVEINRKEIELRDKYKNDPDGFDREWQAYTEGKLGSAEPWALPHLKKSLGSSGNQGYAATLGEKRRRDEQLDGQRMKALIEQEGNRVIGMAMAGRLPTEEGQAAAAKYQAVLDSAVKSGLMAPEQAELLATELDNRAGAEIVIKGIGDVYRENRRKGVDAGPAALKAAEDNILRNSDLSGLSESQRLAYFNRAKSEITALESERKADLAIAKQSKRDIERVLELGAPVPAEQIDEVAKELEAAGGHADAAKLRASAIRSDALRSYKRQSLEGMVNGYGEVVAETGKFLPGNVNSIVEREAAKYGLPPSFMRRLFKIESGGNVYQVTGSYRGLGQLSLEQFKKYGPNDGRSVFDPEANVIATTRKVADLYKSFKSQMGREPLPYELYMMHQQGTAGAPAHIRNPDAPAWVNMWGTGEGRAKGQNWAKQAIWGNIPTQYKKLFPGGVESVTSRDFLKIWEARFGGLDNVPDLKLIVGQRRIMDEKAEQTWNKISTTMDQGGRPEPRDIELVQRSAAITGNYELLETMGERLSRFEMAQEAGRASLATQQGAAAELSSQPAISPGASKLLNDMQKIERDTRQKLDGDAISLAYERFPERFSVPPPIDFNAPREQVIGAMRERSRVASFVAENYGKPDVSILNAADKTAVASAISGPDGKKAAAAMDMLASVPTQYLSPTLNQPEIRDAIKGAVRSTNPETYVATMTALDKIWDRNPVEFEKTFGGDVVREVQDWQAKLRYASVKDLTEKLVRRDDPQVITQRKQWEEAGRRLVQNRTPDELLADLDPGIFERQPGSPIDPRVRDAAMGDYNRLFVERYAATLDEGMAKKQALEQMKLYWGKSEINNGRLMLRPPERYYKSVGGSHAWMREQLRNDVMDTLKKLPDEFDLVTDRQTEADIASGRPPSYLVVYRDSNQPADVMRKPDGSLARVFFDDSKFKKDAEADFEKQREVFKSKAERRAAAASGGFADRPVWQSGETLGPSPRELIEQADREEAALVKSQRDRSKRGTQEAIDFLLGGRNPYPYKVDR